jgi:hypothetical protein
MMDKMDLTGLRWEGMDWIDMAQGKERWQALHKHLGKHQKFKTNSGIHSLSTRYRYNLHVPNTNLSKYQKKFTILELSYPINVHLISKVQIMI